MPDLIDLIKGADCDNEKLPGLKGTIKGIKSCDIDTVPAAATHVVSTDITLKATKAWNDLSDFDDAQANFTWEKPHGKKCTTTVVVFLPGITSTKKEAAAGYNSAQITMGIPDVNGDTHLIGDASSGIKFDVAGATLTRADDGTPGITMTGIWESEDQPYKYTGTF